MAEEVVSVESFAARIRRNWQKLTESILEVASVCAEASGTLSPAEKKQLLESLPFSPATFSKLVQIGHDQRLHSDEVRGLLPPNYSIIYSIGRLDGLDFHDALTQGVISPTLKRADLEKWRHKITNKEEKERRVPPLPDAYFAALLLKSDLSEAQRTKLCDSLEALKSEFCVEVVYAEDRYIKAMGRWHERVRKAMVAQIRRRVRETTKDRKRKHGSAFANNPTLRKYAGLSWDEVELDNNATQEEMRFVLNSIGCDDEFDELWALAEAKIPLPKLPNGYTECRSASDGLEEAEEALLRLKHKRHSRDKFEGIR